MGIRESEAPRSHLPGATHVDSSAAPNSSAGAAAFGVVSVLAACSTSAWMFIASRALLGIAGAILPPPMLSLIFKAGAPAQSPADVRVRGLRAGERRAEVGHGGVGCRETDRQELAAQVHEDGPSSQPENTR